MGVVAELEEALKVVDSCLSRINWRLKPTAKRRLQTDIMALCTGLRPLVMVDYGGKMPELQQRLCALLQLSQKESSTLGPLRVMVIEDMIYLLHVSGFAEYVRSSLNSETNMHFVDLEHDPPKIMVQGEQSSVSTGLLSIQKFFSVVFPDVGMSKESLPCPTTQHLSKDKSPIGELIASSSSEFIDLSSCMQDSPVTIPTLNGWLLGYPVVYLFGKEHIADAICNLSTKSLRLFKILIRRNGTSSKELRLEELMSFSVPYDLSMGGENEPWAEAFLACMLTKLEKCNQAWSNMQMENLSNMMAGRYTFTQHWVICTYIGKSLRDSLSCRVKKEEDCKNLYSLLVLDQLFPPTT